MSDGRNFLPTQERDGSQTRRLRGQNPRRNNALAARTAPTEPQPLDPAEPPAQREAVYTGRGDDAFHPGLLDLDEAPKSPIRPRVVLAILALFATALTWSYFGRIASYTEAAGKVQAAGRTKVLEVITGGQVLKILAHDGDRVKQGASLVLLDPTEANANRTIVNQKLIDTRAETLRLRTEVIAARANRIETTAAIPWGADVPATVRSREETVARADLQTLASQLAALASEERAKEAERDKYMKSIEAEKALITVTKENMAMIDTLTQQGFNSKAQYLDYKAKLDGQQVTLTGLEGSLDNAKQAILTVESQIAKTRESFITTNTRTIANNEQAIVDLTQQLVKTDQTLANMTLRAPVDGVVHASAVTTIGQVVKPGQQLMQIVPEGGAIEIETYVPNTDIGFIQVGDDATIKVTTFTYGVYGSMDGKVASISKDALPLQGKSTEQSASLDGEIQMTTAAQKTGNIQFPVIVRTLRSTMRVDGKDMPLTPGMTVSVEIETENRRAIDYIVSPILELFSTAAHEK